MMDYKDFENKMQEYFQQFSPEVNEEAIWAAVEEQLPERKKSNYLLLFLMVGTVIMVGWLGNTFMDKYSEFEQISNNSEVLQPTINAQISEGVLVSEETINHKEVSISGTEKPVLDQVQEELHAKTVMAETVARLSRARIDSVTEETEVYLRDQTVISSQLADIQANRISEAGMENVRSEFRETMKPVLQGLGAQSEKDVTDEKKEFQGPEIDVAEIEEKSLPVQEAQLILIETEEESHIEDFNTLQVEDVVEEAAEKSNKFSFKLGGSYSTVMTSYTADGPGAQLMALSQSIERPLESLRGDLQSRIKLGKHWQVGVGISFSRLTESAIHGMRASDTNTIEMMEGTTHTSSTVIRETTSKVQRFRIYNRLSLPLSVIYSGDFTDRIGYELEGGFILGMWSRVQGYELNLDGTEYDLDSDMEERVNSENVNELLFGGRLTYEFSNKLKVYGGVVYSYGLSNVYASDYLITKRYDLLGLSGGLIYNINKN